MQLKEKDKRCVIQVGGLTLAEAMAAAEKQILLECLRRNNWQRQVTARMLNIGRTTLYIKMRRYQISEP